MPRGSFIAIDGTDGSGKTVQSNRLLERIREAGRDAEVLSFPRYGNPAAYFVEKYLRGEYGSPEDVGAKRASIFYALDRYDDAARIRSVLEQGTVLVTNRYVSANKGHQMGKIEGEAAQQAFLDWLNDLEYGIFGIPKPDLTILLHVPAEVGLKLAEERDRDGVKSGGSTDIHQEINHLKKAEAAYLKIPKMDTAENWQVIECTRNGELMSIDAIHDRVWTLVEPLLA